MYTCLSRGSSVEGTIIIQSFDFSKLIGGISGSLRQEFRELELLDEITKLRYLGNISPKVVGITRNELIHSFRQWKGENHMPNSLHAALQWDHSNPFPIEPVTEDSPWTVINNTKKSELIDEQATTNINQKFKRNVTAFVPEQGSKPVTVSTKYRKFFSSQHLQQNGISVICL